MSTEPTSVLTFQDLILDVARKLGYAHYGVDGDEVIQIPTDAHDLDECKRLVNKGIRRFIMDGPQPNGWHWTRPVQTTDIWGTIAAVSTNLITSSGFDSGANETTLDANASSFFESMEEKPIVITGVGTFTIKEYVSDSQIKVTGDATGATGVTWSVTADGNYTLSRIFSGMYTGDITYISDTNQGVTLTWTGEATIRQWRENITDETGDPYWAAIRPMATGTPRRRWELILYPKPDEIMTTEFPYNLYFDKLVNLTEVHPAPFSHDEAIRAACLTMAESDSEDIHGTDTKYYMQMCLPNSLRIDAQSGPKKLGYFGNNSGNLGMSQIKFFRNFIHQRQNITFIP